MVDIVNRKVAHARIQRSQAPEEWVAAYLACARMLETDE